jgi:hypothetical protein
VDEEQVARVARALCAFDGKDPEEHVDIGGVTSYRRGNEMVTGPVRGPQWRTYRVEAQRFMIAFNAASTEERPKRKKPSGKR